MISRISSAPITRSWMRSERANEVSPGTGRMESVEMLAHAGDQQGEDAPRDQPQHQHDQHRADAPRFDRVVRQIGLNDALEVELLLLPFIAGELERGERRRELLLGEAALQRKAF